MTQVPGSGADETSLELAASVPGFLTRVARRLRLAWALAISALVSPVVAGLALLLVLLGWVAPWRWPEPSALVLVVAALGAVLAWAIVQPLPLLTSARAADRGLGSKDIFAAALQFKDLDDSFGYDIRRRADRFASGASPTTAIPLGVDPAGRNRWLVAAVLGIAALVLAVVANPQDEERARREALQEQTDGLADEVEELVEDLEGQIEATPELDAESPALAALLEDLEQLAEQLPEAESLEEAKELLKQAQQQIDAQRPSNFASQEAAAQGLRKSLEAQPLDPRSGADSSPPAAEQVQALADELAADPDALTDDEQEALAERLAQLAEAQSLGDPATAAALAAAADALAAGNAAAASASLGEAAAAQAANASGVAAQQAAGQASGELGQLAQSPGEAQGEGQGQGEGEGQGQGEGSGQGEGQGAGSGEGQGEGSGSGSGGGSPSGTVGGAAGGTGAGQGGVGNPGGSDQPRVEEDNSGFGIVDPAALESGEPLNLGGRLTGDGLSETVGTADGPTEVGGSRIPVSDVATDYAQRASEALDRTRLAPSQQELVGNYFDKLTDGQ